MRIKYLKVADGKRLHIEAYPSFHVSNSVAGMKKQFYGEDALLVKCGSYIYNVGGSEPGRDVYYSRAY